MGEINIDHRDSARTVQSFASRVTRRIIAAGAPPHLAEDIRQEMWIAWCKARDTFEADKGCSFNTYLHSGIRMHINRWCEKHVSRRHSEVIALSMDATHGDDESMSLGDIIPSADPTAEELTIEQTQWDYVMKHLDPRARKFLTLLRDQPKELLEQVAHIEIKAERAKRAGTPLVTYHRITTALVYDVMGASTGERLKIAAHIREVCAKLGDRL